MTNQVYKRMLITQACCSLLFILLVFFVSCSQKKSIGTGKKSSIEVHRLDTSIVAILPLSKVDNWIFKECRQGYLTDEEQQTIEVLLTRCIDEYNEKQEIDFERLIDRHPGTKLNRTDFVIDLRRYKRQYVVAINRSGEKELWVNCFCNTQRKNWKTDVVFVSDGGNCYFNLKINLSIGK